MRTGAGQQQPSGARLGERDERGGHRPAGHPESEAGHHVAVHTERGDGGVVAGDEPVVRTAVVQ